MKLGLQMEGLEAVRATLDGFSPRRLRAAQATALTRTARELEGEWIGEIFSSIDRPIGATARAVGMKPATAQDMVAEVFIKNRPSRADAPAPVEWLAPQEEGGARFVKKFERALMAQGSMPSGHKVVPGPYAKLDGYGNISRGQIVQVIAQLGTQFSPGYQRVIGTTAAKRMASAKRRGREYVAIARRVGGNKLPLGVYERSGRDLLPVFLYVTRVQYRKRLQLQERAREVGPSRLAAQTQRAITEHIGRIAARNAAIGGGS